jgi:oligopeptide/dipeptide ABC transporter ATP-binding protein
MKDLRDRLGIALLLITHNPAIFSGFADRVLVMYGGRIVEEAQFTDIIRQPLHPYTKALLDSTPPAPGSGAVKKRLPMIAAARALRQSENTGCPFEPRCPDRLPICSEKEPPETPIDDQRRVRCFKYSG